MTTITDSNSTDRASEVLYIAPLPIMAPLFEHNDWLEAFISQLAQDSSTSFVDFEASVMEAIEPLLARDTPLPFTGDDLNFELRALWVRHGRSNPLALSTVRGVEHEPSYQQLLATFLDETRDPDPRRRQQALKELCPCHVKADVDEFWQRICAMTTDPDAGVRFQALHNLCDGSTRAREDQVIAAISNLVGDPDLKVRRTCNRILAMYRKTARWNYM